MKQTLSLISKIHEKGNRFIIEQLKANGIEGLVPSHGDILAYLYCCEKCTMKEIAEKISKIINYPAEASIGYPTPGSFGTYAGVERNIPTITLELDETCPIKDLLKPVHKIFEEVKRTVL